MLDFHRISPKIVSPVRSINTVFLLRNPAACHGKIKASVAPEWRVLGIKVRQKLDRLDRTAVCKACDACDGSKWDTVVIVRASGRAFAFT